VAPNCLVAYSHVERQLPMRVRKIIVVASLALFGAAVQGRTPGCDDSSLPPDQRWNGATSFATPALARFYSISEEMSAAYKNGRPVAAKALATEYLQAARGFPCNWNYGNAVHDSNVILGLVALHSGGRDAAAEFLLAAAKTPGSPQLNSFGPSLLLAKELAQAGEFPAVVSYLRSVRKFWKPEDSSVLGALVPYFKDPDPMSTWIKEAEARKVPDFSPFNMHAP
jgi:hypothetical protein